MGRSWGACDQSSIPGRLNLTVAVATQNRRSWTCALPGPHAWLSPSQDGALGICCWDRTRQATLLLVQDSSSKASSASIPTPTPRGSVCSLVGGVPGRGAVEGSSSHSLPLPQTTKPTGAGQPHGGSGSQDTGFNGYHGEAKRRGHGRVALPMSPPTPASQPASLPPGWQPPPARRAGVRLELKCSGTAVWEAAEVRVA